MEKKFYITFEVEKKDHTYRFLVPNNANYGEVRDVIVEMYYQVMNEMQQADKRIQEEMNKAKETKSE